MNIHIQYIKYRPIVIKWIIVSFDFFVQHTSVWTVYADPVKDPTFGINVYSMHLIVSVLIYNIYWAERGFVDPPSGNQCLLMETDHLCQDAFLYTEQQKKHKTFHMDNVHYQCDLFCISFYVQYITSFNLKCP